MYPCHRLGYEGFWFGQMVEDDNDILKFKTKNTELLVATFASHKESMPYCSSCPIKTCCTGQCLGAQYESNKNLFAPIPSVCVVAHAIIATIIECLLKYDTYYLVYRDLSKEQQVAFDFVKKEIEKHYDF
jgi:radical SAM protein with 4Fe4S-binding SPASM domain